MNSHKDFKAHAGYDIIKSNIKYLKVCFRQMISLLNEVKDIEEIEVELGECKKILETFLINDKTEEIVSGIISFGNYFKDIISKNKNTENNDYLRMILFICLEIDKTIKNKEIHKHFSKISILFNQKIRTNKIILVRYRDSLNDVLGVFSDMDSVRNAIDRKGALYSFTYRYTDFLAEESMVDLMWW